MGRSNSCIHLCTAQPTFCCWQSPLARADAWELQLFFPHPPCRGQPHWWHQHCSAVVTHPAAMLLEPARPHPSPLPAAFSISRWAPFYCQHKCLCSYVQNQVRDLIPAKKIAWQYLFIYLFSPAGISSSVWFLGWLRKNFGWHMGGKRTGVEISNFAMRAPPKWTQLFHWASPPLSASVGWSCKGNHVLALCHAPRTPHPPFKERCSFPIHL